eukprot:2883497-Ditylum_brightwellii.AAC.2
MQTGSKGLDTFKDFIRDNSALYALRSDNSKVQIGVSFKHILKKYNIQSENTEPHHPNQNSAEHSIQDVKQTSAKILDQTGALNKEAFPNLSESLGYWLGIAENKGNALTYWILADNKQVLARSLVSLVQENEANKQAPVAGEVLDPDAVEVEGSGTKDISLNLLLEIVNSLTPVLDPTEVNGFQPEQHIGLEFIHKDDKGVPTKATVVEVDEDT